MWGVQGRTDIPDSVGILLEFEVQFDKHVAKTFAASLVWYIIWNVYVVPHLPTCPVLRLVCPIFRPNPGWKMGCRS